ncbi:UNVERIFIED_CONTAM: hypothetical protein FKN15_001827 [Acipenser sinensis]
MGRQRHGKRVISNSSKDGSDSVPHGKEDKKKDIANSILHRKEKKKKLDIAKLFINISIGLCIFSLMWFFYAIYMRSYMARRIITPHSSPKILDPNSTSPAVSPHLFWGSYRPQVYFGMKTRSPKSVVTGLMWMRQFGGMDVNLRHTCEQGDQLQSYGWLMHDGMDFGIQEVRDTDFTLTTEFVKRQGGEHGGDWSWRITAKQQSPAAQAPVISLMLYVATDSQGSLQAHIEERNRLGSVTGSSEELGRFKLTFRKPSAGESSTAKYASYNHLKTVSPGLEKLTDIVKNSLSGRFIYNPPSGEKRHYIAVDTYKPPPPQQQQQQRRESRKESDFVVHQVTVQAPFQIEVLFESASFRDRPSQLAAEVLTEELEKRKSAFDAKFEETFGLHRKGLSSAKPRCLHCWMALASGIMADVAKLLGEPHQDYEKTHQILSDNSVLEELHWSEQLKTFADYGNHTQLVALEREKVYVPPGQPRHQFPTARLVRSVRKAPKLQYVNSLGYVSLFPFLLQILQPDSPKLEHILKDMRDDQKLWTRYGLRSLSKSDPLFMKRNTEHDAPYWRGPIWININYLAVRALHYYANTEGPYKEKSASLYQELRTNIIENVYSQYMETGCIWEQYNDSTGRGQGSHPFTGWSALCVLMMAEQY